MIIPKSDIIDYKFIEDWDLIEVNSPFLEIDHRLPNLDEIVDYIISREIRRTYRPSKYAKALCIKELSYR